MDSKGNKGIMRRNAERKQQEAKARNEKWASKTSFQQLASLDSRFGIGKGAVKQRARIMKIDVRDVQAAAEPQTPPLELPPNAPATPMETHLDR